MNIRQQFAKLINERHAFIKHDFYYVTEPVAPPFPKDLAPRITVLCAYIDQHFLLIATVQSPGDMCDRKSGNVKAIQRLFRFVKLNKKEWYTHNISHLSPADKLQESISLWLRSIFGSVYVEGITKYRFAYPKNKDFSECIAKELLTLTPISKEDFYAVFKTHKESTDCSK